MQRTRLVPRESLILSERSKNMVLQFTEQIIRENRAYLRVYSRVDMKVVLTWVSKGHPGCTGAHQEKGRKLRHWWQLHEREAFCGKRL